MPPALLIFLGGGLGAVSRWGLSSLITQFAGKTPFHRFPWGILTCNLIGCFAIGLVFGATASRSHPSWLHPLLVTGFLGGFTTFSTFGNDTRQMLSEGFHGSALAHVLVSTLGGIALVIFGFRLAHSFSQ
ncbi:MAG: fluoride efflux transporter CrcB [Verrucomicrobiales bacterium]